MGSYRIAGALQEMVIEGSRGGALSAEGWYTKRVGYVIGKGNVRSFAIELATFGGREHLP